MPRNTKQLTVGTMINPEFQGIEWESRAEELEDDLLIMSAPPEELAIAAPAEDAVVNISWNRPPNRYRVRAAMLRPAGGRWRLRIVSDPEPVTRRTFYRGGGGEVALLRHEDDTQWQVATVEDISEAALRCFVTELQFVEGDPVCARVTLGEATLDVSGTVLLTREPEKTCEDKAEVVVLYTLSESQGKQVRRYLLEWQLAERRRAQNNED
ncbi:hypothetical protein [Actinoplanes sp. NPDC049681]|uniref:hypothetical protein n=1 Tax=Actinoplanes sp. NPDC049681 TaxID=3363905 RepID=UPI0037B7C5A4